MTLSKILLEEICKAIDSGKETKYSIAVGSGIDHAVIRRFISGERDIKLRTADKLAAYLSLNLTKDKKKRL